MTPSKVTCLDAKVMIDRAADAIQNIITRGLEKTMNQFNA